MPEALLKNISVPDRFKVLATKPGAWNPFPKVDPLIVPTGSDVLVQVRTPRTKTEGGIILSDQDKETERWNTQVGVVRALGALAYHNRNTLEPWPEGAWCKVGDYVRIPKFGGDRWEVEYGSGPDDAALFVLFRDTEIRGVIPGGYDAALQVKAYVK